MFFLIYFLFMFENILKVKQSASYAGFDILQIKKKKT